MKVLFAFGGIPLYLNRLLGKLTEKGVDVTAVVPDGRSVAVGKNVEMSRGQKTYRVVTTPERRSPRSRKPHFPALKDILAAEKPDIVVIGWPYFLDLYFDRRLLKTIRQETIRLIVREIPFQVPPCRGSRRWFRKHPVYDEQMNLLSRGLGFRLRSAFLRHVRRFVYKRADASINYSSVAHEILPGYGIPNEKIFVTHNSPDVETLWKQRETIEKAPRLLPENPCRILHIGRLVKWKRVDLLLEATGLLAERFPGTELVVVGDGPELENLRKQAAETGVADRVRFVGAVYDPLTLAQYMHESSVYALAGMGGLSINEAMACGLPVVCSVCDGTEKDLVVPEHNGFFFREGDAGSLADKLALLLDDPEKCRRMGANALQTVREKINMDTVTDRFIEAFKSVLP